MGTTVSDNAGHSSTSAQTAKTKIWGGTPFLCFVIFLTLSCLLWRLYPWTKQWRLILASELSAAVAGISLGRFLVGDQSKERRKSPSTAFFDARMQPLQDRVNDLVNDLVDEQKKQAERDRNAAEKAAAEEEAPKKTAAEEKAAAEKVVDKMLEPEYAIGQGLISREEYNDFRNTYLAQSELSLGLILPFLLFIFALDIKYIFAAAIEPKDIWSWLSMQLVVVVSSCVLFFLAMERRQKYRIELGLLLLSRWEKQRAADKAAKEAKAKPYDKSQEDAIRRILKEELKGLHLEVKPLIVEVRKSPKETAENKKTARSKPEEGVS